MQDNNWGYGANMLSTIKRRSRWMTVAVLSASCFAGIATTLGAPSARAAGLAAGTGSTYCQSKGATNAGANFLGVYACSDGRPNSTSYWQCVELAERFIQAAVGFPVWHADTGALFVAAGAWSIPGQSLWPPAPAHPLPVGNPGPGSLPNPGDIMSYTPLTTGGDGHVAVVVSVAVTSQSLGNAAIKVMEENWNVDGTDAGDNGGYNTISVNSWNWSEWKWNSNRDFSWLKLGLSGGNPTPTTPPQSFPTSWMSLHNFNSSKCVDARGGGTANGTAIQQYDCNGSNAQQFEFVPVTGGYFEVENRNAPSQVWDVTGVSTADGAPIQLYGWGGGNNQQWTPVAEGNGFYHFVSRNTGKCLDVPGASTASGVQLQQYGCNGTGAQSFLPFPATYVSVVNRNSGKCVDVRGGGTANGTAIQQYDCNGSNAQKFWFASNGGSWFAVANLNAPSQVWDVTGVSTADGAPIQLYGWGGGNNQQWTPVAEGNGFYHFVSRNTGKCLDVPGASTASGVQLQQYGCNGTGAQSFRLA
jgi:hypothetical protein